MIQNIQDRHIQFESILNFRDLGGLHNHSGKNILRKRIFRSAELGKMTNEDFRRIRSELNLTSVIDLRSKMEVEHKGTGLISNSGIKYHNISFIPNGGDPKADEIRYRQFKNMGEFYLDMVGTPGYGRHLVDALEVIASPINHPLVFHCAVGKDRTGVLAAVLLSILEIPEEDIVYDYTLSESAMQIIYNTPDPDPHLEEDKKKLPAYFWKASPESMELFLAGIKQSFGSIRQYLVKSGAEKSLFTRLEQCLLS